MKKIEAEVFENLTNIKNKLVVDTLNSLCVAGDHIKVQKKRDDLFCRIWDGFTGASNKRQRIINQSILNGVDNIQDYLMELTNGVDLTNRHVVNISKSIDKLVENVELSVDVSSRLSEELDRIMFFTKEKLDENNIRISKIERSISAEREVSYVLSKWEAGRLNHLSIAGRCFVVLDELVDGCFGDYVSSVSIQQKRIILETLQNKIQVQMFKDLKMENNDSVRVLTERLFSYPNTHASIDYKNAVFFLGNQLEPDNQPLSYFSVCKPKERSLLIPYVSRTSTFISTMISEQKW